MLVPGSWKKALVRFLIFFLAMVMASTAWAAPPPPPPEHIYKAGLILSSSASDVAKIAPLLANDVVIVENGRTVATDKETSLKMIASSMDAHARRVIAYSAGSEEILVTDTYDYLPPVSGQFDPRMAGRSTLYLFGGDRLIHAVHVSIAKGFWAIPRN
jgi:hypothetical protein